MEDLSSQFSPGIRNQINANVTLTSFFSQSLRFLDVLAARKDPAGLCGEVLINGALQPPNFKCLSGYVVQVQCMHHMSSIYETKMSLLKAFLCLNAYKVEEWDIGIQHRVS